MELMIIIKPHKEQVMIPVGGFGLFEQQLATGSA